MLQAREIDSQPRQHGLIYQASGFAPYLDDELLILLTQRMYSHIKPQLLQLPLPDLRIVFAGEHPQRKTSHHLAAGNQEAVYPLLLKRRQLNNRMPLATH